MGSPKAPAAELPELPDLEQGTVVSPQMPETETFEDDPVKAAKLGEASTSESPCVTEGSAHPFEGEISEQAAAAITHTCYCCLQHRKLTFSDPLWVQTTLRMSAADGQAKETAEEAVTALEAPPEATDEELERAALLSAWRSRPDDPVSVSRALGRAGPHAGMRRQQPCRVDMPRRPACASELRV